jgi:hypothetical protein
MAAKATNSVYYLDPKKTPGGGGCYYLNPLNKVYYLTEDPPFDQDFSVTVSHHMVPKYGEPLVVELPKGDYVITPLGGACNDSGGQEGYWTWHLKTSAGDLGGEYSLEAVTFGAWADTPEQAFGSVADERLKFSWSGGSFSMWLPHNDVIVPTNNSGSLRINVKKIKKDKP